MAMKSRFLIAGCFVLVLIMAASLNLFWSPFASALDATSTNFFVRQNVVPMGVTSYTGNKPANITSGLEAWWKFDEGTGATVADSSGHSYTMNLFNTPTWGVGQISSGLTFNGTTQYGSIASLDLSTVSAITVSFWAQNLVYAGAPNMLESSADFTAITTGFGIFPGDTPGGSCTSAMISFGIKGDVGFNTKCYTNPGSSWHHYTVIFDKSQAAANEITFYVDGSVQTAIDQPNTSNNTNNFGNNTLYVMSRAGTTFFEGGSLDDLRVYRRALSASEISSLASYSGDLPTQSFATSTSFKLFGTGGETAVGTSTSASFGLLGGFIRNLYKGPAPTYTQIHYHWRNDDGSEAAATSKTSGVQDTDITGLAKSTGVRLRVEIANEGGSILSYSTQQFRIEYGLKVTTCSAIASWVDVGAVAGDWDMFNSSSITDGNNTTNIAVATGGVTDENHTFISASAGVKDTSSTAAAISVSSEQFIEIEYSIQALAAATDGGTYCFRVTNAGTATNYSYSLYPQATVTGGSLTFTTDGTTESFGTVTPGVLVATTSILTVNTGNTTGFNITINRDDSTGTMSFGSIYIPDKTDWVPGGATTSVGNATASTTEAQKLQFRVRLAGTDTPNYASVWWGTADTTAAALFAGIPPTAKQIVNRSVSAGTDTVTRVLYNLTTPVTQQNGSYSGGITYTATANP